MRDDRGKHSTHLQHSAVLPARCTGTCHRWTDKHLIALPWCSCRDSREDKVSAGHCKNYPWKQPPLAPGVAANAWSWLCSLRSVIICWCCFCCAWKGNGMQKRLFKRQHLRGQCSEGPVPLLQKCHKTVVVGATQLCHHYTLHLWLLAPGHVKLTTSATTKSQPAVTLPKSPASCCHMGPPPGLASSSLQFTTGPSSFVASAVKQNNGYAAILGAGNCYLSIDSAVWTLTCHLLCLGMVYCMQLDLPTLSRKPSDAPLLQPVGSASPHSGDRRWQHRLLVACHSGHSEEAPHGPGLKNQKCYSTPTEISLMSCRGHPRISHNSIPMQISWAAKLQHRTCNRYSIQKGSKR